MPYFLYLLHPFEGCFLLCILGFDLKMRHIPFFDVLALKIILIATDEITEVYYPLRESVELIRDRLQKSF
jgi:hypothetical protein